MSNLVDQLTLGELKILALDADPSVGGGYSAEVGSYASINNTGSPVGAMYLKTGAGNTQWDRLSTTALAGVVSTGTAGRLSLYATTGNTVSDTYTQNTQAIDVNIRLQPTRSVPIQYTIPNPGDAVTAADFVLTEGTQTVNGDKTFVGAITVSGSMHVTGTLTYVDTTNLTVTDKLITLNKGGIANSGNGSGFEVEEAASIVAYLKTQDTAPTSTGWLFKAPDSQELLLDQVAMTGSRTVTLQDQSGYMALQSPATLTTGSVTFIVAGGLLSQDNANFFWDNTAKRLGLGNNAPADTLHVTGSVRVSGNTNSYKLLAESDWSRFQAQVNTVDATQTTLATVAVPSNSIVYLSAVIVGRRTGGTGGSAQDSGVYRRTVRLKNVAGTVTLFNLQSDYTSEDTAGFNATITVSGTNALVRVTGAANVNMNWEATVEKVVND